MQKRAIAHLDMDAFFAAVEEREHESLRALPLVVGADPEDGRGRGVVSTANYKARAYGIHSAMPISRAWHLSEAARQHGKQPAVFLRASFHLYRETSARIMAIIREYSSAVEEAGIDEAYFDLPPCSKLSLHQEKRLIRAKCSKLSLDHRGGFGAVRVVAEKIKQRIRDQERLTCSIGIGPNKLIAKIASDMEKPDGLTIVAPEDAERFLEPLPLRKIPGIGPKAEAMFRNKGMALVRDLKVFSRGDMTEMMGKWGNDLYDKIRGRDERLITESYEPKSIGEQETFARDTLDPAFLFERLNTLCVNIHTRLAAEGFSGFRTAAATIRFADFETLSRSHTLTSATDSLQTLQFEAMKLVMPFLDARENPGSKKIRLLGVRVEKLSAV